MDAIYHVGITKMLDVFRSPESALLELLAAQLVDDLLLEIAGCDAGMNWEDNFIALKNIRDTHRIPAPLDWIPSEVLKLQRWCEPDKPEPYSNPSESKGRPGHLIRAFCCAVLIVAADNSGTRDLLDTEDDTAIQLTASVLRLGPEMIEAGFQLLCWRVSRLSVEEFDLPFFAITILLLFASLEASGDDASDLRLLSKWVVREEQRARSEEFECPLSDEWLLGLTDLRGRAEVLRNLIPQILLARASTVPPEIAVELRSIVNRLE